MVRDTSECIGPIRRLRRRPYVPHRRLLRVSVRTHFHYEMSVVCFSKFISHWKLLEFAQTQSLES